MEPLFADPTVRHYALVFVFGFLGGIFITLRDDPWKSLVRVLSAGVVSGILAYAVVSIWFGNPTDDDANPALSLGVAALLGIFGRRVESEIFRHLYERAFGQKIGTNRSTDTLDHDGRDRDR